ncbi:CBO0543 family protein [Niallia sp. FSL R7-0271]|uniref:CBO0543 family protein n=1 Tax=Niallia sp. FSL R7-0271 TaxID=2921678 RepID=UPI0030FB1220
MKEEQRLLLEEIRKAEIAQSDRWLSYWQQYSNMDTWQFWVVLMMFLLPLLVLILFIDRKKVFQLGFYGYGIHLFFAIIDSFGVIKGLWIYPYKLLPGLPASIALDSSFVPVTYILLYQYILNNKKNYYIWMLMLCLVFAFFLKPLMVGLGLFRFGGRENFLMLFWGYAAVALIPKWITDFFMYLLNNNRFSLHNKLRNLK